MILRDFINKLEALAAEHGDSIPVGVKLDHRYFITADNVDDNVVAEHFNLGSSDEPRYMVVLW